MVENKT